MQFIRQISKNVAVCKVQLRRASRKLCDKMDPSCDISQCAPEVKYLLPARFKASNNMPAARYGGKHLVTVVPGSGIGPEIMCHVKDTLDFISAPLKLEEIPFIKTADIDGIIDSISRNQLCLKGYMDSHYDTTKAKYDTEDSTSPNALIRKRLNLFAGFCHFLSYKHIQAKYNDIDIIVVRQMTESEYTMLEYEAVPGIVSSLKVVTEENSRVIAEWALKFAQKHKREKVTIIHKASESRSDELFLRTCLEVAKCYPEVIVDDMQINRAAKLLTQTPHHFDMLLCPNLYGTVLANIINGLINGVGFTGASLMNETLAVFEAPSRNRATNLMGKNIANPCFLLNSAANLLSHIGETEKAQLLREGLRQTIEDDLVHTNDMGGECTTDQFIYHLQMNLRESLQLAHARNYKPPEDDFVIR